MNEMRENQTDANEEQRMKTSQCNNDMIHQTYAKRTIRTKPPATAARFERYHIFRLRSFD